MVKVALPLLALLLAGCGYKGQLSAIDPAAMDKAALKTAREAEKASVTRALTPTPEQRPVRVDDVVIRLEERRDDPFNLPPE